MTQVFIRFQPIESYGILGGGYSEQDCSDVAIGQPRWLLKEKGKFGLHPEIS